MESLEFHVERLLKEQLSYMLEELGYVDARLLELRWRSDDDSRIESLVLRAYRDHLIEDLEELLGYASAHNIDVIDRYDVSQAKVEEGAVS